MMYIKKFFGEHPVFMFFMVIFGVVVLVDVIYIIFTSEASPSIVVIAGTGTYFVLGIAIAGVLKVLGLWSI